MEGQKGGRENKFGADFTNVAKMLPLVHAGVGRRRCQLLNTLGLFGESPSPFPSDLSISLFFSRAR